LVTAVGGTALEYGWKWNPKGSLEDYLDCKSRQNQQKMANPKATPAACPNDFFASEEAPGSRIETIWKEDWAMAGGGGGISSVFGMPDYQRQTLPQAIRDQSRGFRTIPDVSMHAAINGGVMCYSSYVIPGQDKTPSWGSVGGTSAATPEMAALVALAGQRASDLMGKKVGIGALNPLLYSINSADFNDMVPQTFGAKDQIVIDNNGLYFSDLGLQIFGPTSETPVPVAGYSVLSGYDMATGLGTPIADRFVEDLARARAMQDQTRIQTQNLIP
jgi:subtilase family serine protease